MTEPEGWSEPQASSTLEALEATPLERTLLNAAKADQIPSALALRMASALPASSIAPAAGPSLVTQGANAHGAKAGLLSTKAGLWGFLSLALLAGTGAFFAASSRSSSAPHVSAAPQPSSALSVTAVTAVTPVPAVTATSPATITAPTLAASSATDLPAPVMQVPAPAQVPASAKTPVVMSARSILPRKDSAALREEIAMLDRAREALERGEPQRAQSLLDQHRRRFAQGTLLPEAEAMRIETLVRLGDTERAKRLSQRFSRAYPEHPLRARVSELTGSAQPTL